MENRLIRLILAGLAAVAFSPVLFAQSAAQAGARTNIPDFSGVWDRPIRTNGGGGAARRGGGGGYRDAAGGAAARQGGGDDIPGFAFTKEEPPMTPWAAEKYKAVRTGVVRGPYDKGIDALDPNLYCFPPGPTRIFTIPRPFEIHQFPEEVYLLTEWDHWVRRIYMDGRGHPDGYPITWMGHSIGKYEGNALVVDTVFIHDETWLDSLGHPHSEDLHIVERFRRTDHDTLQIDFTFDDPKAYTKPWTGKKIFKLQPANYEILEHVICEDWLEMGKRRAPKIAQ